MIPIAYHPIYKHPLPEGHRFPMIKYELLPEQLLHEGIAQPQDFFVPDLAELCHVKRVHEADYVDNLLALNLSKSEVRKIGFPLSEALVQRELIITQGTILGVEKSFEWGLSFNIAGGTHHAYPTHGEAFCLLNDQGVAAQYLIDHNKAKKILMLDLDVHQGNGTAVMFKDNPEVFTFSMHGKSNYPFRKEFSDWDMALNDGCSDDEYLQKLQLALSALKDKVKPDFVFYLSGVDILATDKLGKLGCTLKGCYERDLMVFKWIKELSIPVQVSMGGGYSPEIKTIIEAHANTYKAAKLILT